MSSGSWSPDEDERLRKLARSGLSLVEIAHEIRLSKSSVHTRAAKLKIVMARDRSTTTRWSVELGLREKGK
jgi:DNA-binding IclR family transcriptional regulator